MPHYLLFLAILSACCFDNPELIIAKADLPLFLILVKLFSALKPFFLPQLSFSFLAFLHQELA